MCFFIFLNFNLFLEKCETKANLVGSDIKKTIITSFFCMDGDNYGFSTKFSDGFLFHTPYLNSSGYLR